MERIRNKVYNLKDLQEGDRFYFVGNKAKTINEVTRVENRFGSVSHIACRKEFHSEDDHYNGSNLFKQVLFLRNNQTS